RAGLLRPGEGVLGGALRGRARRRPGTELLLHRLHHGPAGARSRRAPACGTSRSAAAPDRAAPGLAGAATPAGRGRGGITSTGCVTTRAALGEKGRAVWGSMVEGRRARRRERWFGPC